jgi:membrane protein YqaA with SNARE-associated domain
MVARAPMIDVAAYASLFFAAFVAATLFPAQSELLLAGLLASGRYSAATLVAVASLGNILGSVVNWGLGRAVERFRDRLWFPVRPDALARAQGWYRRYGRWSLLASWIPVIGDPLTLVAGVLREPFWSFLALVAIAKIGRYMVLALAVSGLV